MKKITIGLFIMISVVVNAATYYVSTTGNDSQSGTINAPWKTWQKGFSSLVAGDILYIRGGRYLPTVATPMSIWSGTSYAGAAVSGKSGTASKPITVSAYPGEHPILDVINIVTTGSRSGIVLKSCNYWILKGFEQCNAFQTEGNGAAGIWLHDSNNCTLERLVVHHNGGSGIRIIQNCEGNLIYNCDAYANNDNFTDGENADGFEIANTTYRAGNPRVNTMRGCRAWWNSDDGVDLFRNDGYMIMDSCWFWSHGYDYDTRTLTVTGDGNGIKLGTTEIADGTEFLRTVTNCLIFYNYGRGIEQNAANAKCYVYNNTVLKNGGVGIKFYSFNLANIFKNNISCLNTGGNWDGVHTNAIVQNNSYHSTWQTTGPVATEADFLTIDTVGLAGPRQANGCLPIMSFARLASTSDMIDHGTDVGISYFGTAPDIGAYEYTPYPLSTESILAANKTVNVYPNPVSDELTIEIEDNDVNLKFEIINAIGTVVVKGIISDKVIVQANYFVPGIYTIKVGNGKYSITRKIIKL